MSKKKLHAARTDNQSAGELTINVTSSLGLIPIQNASISISYKGDPETVIEELTTDSSGQTETITLPAPPIEYSMEPSEEQPYSEYNIRISAPGYDSLVISGTEVLPDTIAIQDAALIPTEAEVIEEPIIIPDHTLYGDYPPKIPEAEIKPIAETGEIVLSRVVVPEYVVVHDGTPSDSTAQNYYVKYRDYIKNVASSEIYATWPENTIYANILAIMSVTLNRVFTEW